MSYAKFSFIKQCLCNISSTFCFIYLQFQRENFDKINPFEESATDTGDHSTDENNVTVTSTRPCFPNRTELDDLIRDQGLLNLVLSFWLLGLENEVYSEKIA